MNAATRTILQIACFGAVWALAAGVGRADSDVGSQLNRLLGQLPEPGAQIGAMVIDAGDGHVVFERNADEALVPASTQKVLVMAVALDRLSGDFQFVTRIGMVGPHLVVIGEGDPGFGDPRLAEAAGEGVTAVFDRWADVLIERGIMTVRGDLVLDESIFDRQGVHPSWEASDLPRWYAAPVGALNLNDNCLDFTVWPGDSPGTPAHWSVIPTNELTRVENQMTTASGGTPIIHRPSTDFVFQLSGKCSRRGSLQSVSVPDSGLLFGSALRTHLKGRGIDIAGDLVRTSRSIDPTQFQLLAEHRTPLTDVLRRIGHNSQNMFAECLMKRLGFEWSKSKGDSDPVGSWETGRSAIMDGLHRMGVPGQSLQIADGSGLSRENRASAGEMVRLLRRMLSHDERDLFLANLTGTEGEGRLARRLGGVSGTIYAKTGTMRGVRAIVGVVDSAGGDRYCFAIMFNNIKGRSKPFNDLIDKACEIMGS